MIADSEVCDMFPRFSRYVHKLKKASIGSESVICSFGLVYCERCTGVVCGVFEVNVYIYGIFFARGS
jgi:hypothetical protein